VEDERQVGAEVGRPSLPLAVEAQLEPVLGSAVKRRDPRGLDGA
jgi:hypothetical protein